MNEYYEIKHISKENYKEKIDEENIANSILERFNSSTFKLNKNHFDKITFIEIDFSGQPDTIYMNTPLQKPVEFNCFIGGIISLWTGFSMLSIYAYGKRFFIKKSN